MDTVRGRIVLPHTSYLIFAVRTILTKKEAFMFLIDDVLLSPAKGMFYIFKQIHKAAEEEFLDEENVSAELSELYMMLETEKITEDEFNNKESELLKRLGQIEEYKKKHFEVVDEREESEDEDEVRNV